MIAAGRTPEPAQRSRGGGAVPADDLAVAGLSGRRLLLFQRHRMGRRGRRHHRCRVAARTGSPRCWPTAPASATACFWPTPIAPPRATTTRLRDIAELAAAFVPSRERQLETTAQGRAFIDIAARRLELRRAGSADRGLRRRHRLSGRGRPRRRRARRAAGARPLHALPACAGLELDLGRRSRLIPLGQTDSQRVLARLEAGRRRHRQRALTASLDDLGSATFRADLASMRHETQYTRLFRS